MKPLFEGTGIFSLILGLVFIGLGAAGIGIQNAWFAERSNYMEYSNVVSSVAGVQTVGSTLDVAIAGAAIVLVGGLVSAGGAQTKSNTGRLIFIAGLVIALIGGIVELAGGLSVQMSPFLKALGPETYVKNEDRTGELLEGDQSKMALFGLAVFDGCCRPNNWVSQGPFAACGSEPKCPAAGNGELIDDRINLFTDGLDTADLCTCVRPEVQTTYAQNLAAMNEETCNTVKKISIMFPPDTAVPTTCERGFCLRLGFIKNRLYPNEVIDRVPLVGYQLDATSSNGQAEPGFGFGCGLGYPKGIMWIQELYHEQFILPGASSALGLGAASVAIVIIAFALAYFLARDEPDSNWENTLAADWNNPAANPIPSAKIENSHTGPPVTAYQVQANDFSDQLLKFYAKHDPTKTQKEIDGIAAWGKQNGLEALNKKLRDKYGVDLNRAADGGPPI